jgi:hypothetical protein
VVAAKQAVGGPPEQRWVVAVIDVQSAILAKRQTQEETKIKKKKCMHVRTRKTTGERAAKTSVTLRERVRDRSGYREVDARGVPTGEGR